MGKQKKRFKSAREQDAEYRMYEWKPDTCYTCGKSVGGMFIDYKDGGLIVCSRCRKTTDEV